MKKFLIRFILFCLPLAAISYSTDVFVSKELKKSNTYTEGEYSTWNDIYDGKINSDIVVYGSSRAWEHIDPTMITDSLHTTAYNLGINGHTFWLQYLRHKLLLEHNTKPKLIIHSLDIFTLNKGEDLFNPDQFLPYMLFNEEMKNSIADYNGYKLPDFFIPLIRYYGKTDALKNTVKLLLKPSVNPVMRVKGYQGQEKEWNSDFDKVREKMDYFVAKYDTASIMLFDKYLEECKEKNIKVVFVYTPEYIEGQKFIKNKEALMAIYNRFSKKYNIPFYDYSNDPLCFEKKYFYNVLHLNKAGAELFTAKLIQRLKEDNPGTDIWPSVK